MFSCVLITLTYCFLLFPFAAFFVATQVLYTIGFVLLLISTVGVLAIQLCFIIDREIFAMKVLGFVMFLAGKSINTDSMSKSHCVLDSTNQTSLL